MRATSSLRSRKRQETRRRLEEAALRLFAAAGFDRVTVEDICAEAHVGPATFYRHFGTKEEVVFAYREEFARALSDAVTAAQADVPQGQQVPVILSSFARYLESQRDLLALRDRIVQGHEGLMRRTLAVQREVEGQLAAGLARLRGLDQPDDAVRAEAAVAIVVLRMAVRSWRRGRSGSLPEATDASYEQVRRALGAGS